MAPIWFGSEAAIDLWEQDSGPIRQSLGRGYVTSEMEGRGEQELKFEGPSDIDGFYYTLTVNVTSHPGTEFPTTPTK